MALVLHVGVMDRRDAYKTLITAEYCRVKVKAMKADAKRSMLETAAGPVSKSNSMARYIAKLNGDLYPSSVYKYAQVEEWMEFASAEVEEGLKRWIYPRMGVAACDNDHWLEMRIVCVEHSLGVLNTHLAADKKYLVDNGLTLADITMACALHLGFTRAMTKSFTSKFPFVEKYFWNLVGQPEFKKFLGEVKQAESPPEWPLPGVGILDRNYVNREMILERGDDEGESD
ncbi:hypothetical protein LUZ60_008550 [Juncus effusus]|nr:hypothetical protein LUZ60_008550 [Juncus effusus]